MQAGRNASMRRARLDFVRRAMQFARARFNEELAGTEKGIFAQSCCI
jgi:hypothetical protein